MMSDYTYIYIIIAILVVVKLTVWLCIYAARAHRRARNLQQRVIITDGCAIPPQHGAYTQRSPIMDFEELPQPILSVPEGSTAPNYGHIIIQPPNLPSYATAVGGVGHMGVLPDKPPSYEAAVMNYAMVPPGGNNAVPEQATEAGPEVTGQGSSQAPPPQAPQPQGVQAGSTEQPPDAEALAPTPRSTTQTVTPPQQQQQHIV